MNNIDSLYYGAIEMADAGQLDKQAIQACIAQARKFVVLQEDGDAVRYYERVLQLWRSFKESTDSPIVVAMNKDQLLLIAGALSEYANLLQCLARNERMNFVKQEMWDLRKMREQTFAPAVS